jgi:glycosyltransferase involved in cell wall biosynthesis
LVIIVSRLVRGKRLGTALAAASLIPDAVVVVVGDGPLGPALAARFARARFVGQLPRQQALAWMAAADVLITASRNEGAPTVVREARALNLPVVAAPAGDLTAWATSDAELTLISAAASGRNHDLD